jgi:hypothetical protein
VATAQQSGLRYFTLAFIVADPTGRPSWGGYAEYGLLSPAWTKSVSYS